jgi:hypothetical protein
MFARRSKLFLDGQIIAETPLLLPSFSSKGFPQIKSMMKFMSEFITGPILVSAYDIHYRNINPKITFSDLIFLDSGGYEARVEHDLSESYGWPYRPKHWNRMYHKGVLKNWTSQWPTVAITYDNPTQFHKFSDQTRTGKRFKSLYPDFLWEILLKPETKKDQFLGIEKVIKCVHELREFNIIGITEKELDASLFGSMIKIARLRMAMDAAEVLTPIHIFGSLDPLTSVLYLISGAEIFDGLTWLRFGYHDGRTMYHQNYAAIHDADGIRRKKTDQFYEMWKNNYYYLEKLRTQMINYIRTGDFNQFGPISNVIEDAHRQLQAVVAEPR